MDVVEKTIGEEIVSGIERHWRMIVVMVMMIVMFFGGCIVLCYKVCLRDHFGGVEKKVNHLLKPDVEKE